MFSVKATDREAGSKAKPAAGSGKVVSMQRQLTVGKENDPMEREADAVADKVMRMPEQNFVQRKCAACEGEEKLQRKPLSESVTPFIQAKSDSTPVVNNQTAQSIESSRGSGSAMDSRTHSFMSSRFGRDFSDVKIHTGGEAIQLSRDVNAKAFTTGNDIYFNEGQYQPKAAAGKHLLAHELTHVVQQKNSAFIQRKVQIPQDTELESFKKYLTRSDNVYSYPEPVRDKSLYMEIFSSMFHSPRIFKLAGSTNKEIEASLHSHLNSRSGVVDFAAKKQYKFTGGEAGFKMNEKYWEWGGGKFHSKEGVNLNEAREDLNKNPDEYVIGCAAATQLTMKGGGKSDYVEDTTSNERDWIPGDWGYIENKKFDGKPGYEGENIIYVGGKRFWGHFSDAKTYKGFQEWFDQVKSWNGEAALSPVRKYPQKGLKF